MPPFTWTDPFGAVTAVLSLDGEALRSLSESRGALPLGILVLIAAGQPRRWGRA
jgi:hypothetical protein